MQILWECLLGVDSALTLVLNLISYQIHRLNYFDIVRKIIQWSKYCIMSYMDAQNVSLGSLAVT